MKINLAKSAGFCFGVKRALSIAVDTARPQNRVYMLGDIVHNEDVVSKIKKLGIKKTSRLSRGKGKMLLIRAHGASLDIFRKAEKLGFKIIDATCPMVKEIHRIARKAEAKGLRVIIIGDKNHDEVKGIMGQLKQKALVIDGKIPLKSIRGIKKACVVVQSTQNLDNVLKIVAGLKKSIPRLEFHNTICRPTRIKQEEIKKMPKANDVMIIIGSKNSANTGRLYGISKSLNKRSFWVNSKEKIKPEWLKGAQTVGITAGASTPESTIQDIIATLAKSRYPLTHP